ncbi:MAG TPA: hypothetical protein VMT18_04235, partial [Planctomycetota bacterium]|nr:hypothetical protein [Planctomycetota bacterium]
ATAAAGVLAALTGGGEVRVLGLIAAMAMVGELVQGRLSPVGALTIALGVGLALTQLGARAALRVLRGAPLVLGPLVACILFEPTARRIASLQLTVPTFGPVPPAGPLHARPGARHPRRR